jgi:outer membrane lipoprotein SlyB
VLTLASGCASNPPSSSDRAAASFSREESLRAGNALMGTVVHSEKTKIQSAGTTKGYGALLGGLVGVALTAKNPTHQAQSITGLIGAGVGAKVAELVGSDDGVLVYVKVNGTDKIIPVNQQTGQTFNYGDQVLLTDIGGNIRVIKMLASK